MNSETSLKAFVFASLVSVLFSLTTNPTLAEMAPPLALSGTNSQPGEEFTQVRMVAETVPPP